MVAISNGSPTTAPLSGATMREWQAAMTHSVISGHAGVEGSIIVVIVRVDGMSSVLLSVIDEVTSALVDVSTYDNVCVGSITLTPPFSPSFSLSVTFSFFSLFAPSDSPTPTTPLRTILSIVNVPVLSKHRTFNFPAYGMRNGSVQNTNPLLNAAKEFVTEAQK